MFLGKCHAGIGANSLHLEGSESTGEAAAQSGALRLVQFLQLCADFVMCLCVFHALSISGQI